MVSPLAAWTVVIVAIVLTGIIWVASAPVVAAMYGVANGQMNEQAQSAANTLRLEFVALPIALDVGLVLWAILVTTRRQAVTTPGGWQ